MCPSHTTRLTVLSRRTRRCPRSHFRPRLLPRRHQPRRLRRKTNRAPLLCRPGQTPRIRRLRPAPRLPQRRRLSTSLPPNRIRARRHSSRHPRHPRSRRSHRRPPRSNLPLRRSRPLRRGRPPSRRGRRWSSLLPRLGPLSRRGRRWSSPPGNQVRPYRPSPWALASPWRRCRRPQWSSRRSRRHQSARLRLPHAVPRFPEPDPVAARCQKGRPGSYQPPWQPSSSSCLEPWASSFWPTAAVARSPAASIPHPRRGRRHRPRLPRARRRQAAGSRRCRTTARPAPPR